MTLEKWVARIRLECPDVNDRRQLADYGTVFTHFDDDDGTQRHWAAGLMKRDPVVLAHEIVTFTPDPAFAQWMLKRRGVEQHRLIPLLAVPAMEMEPVLFASWMDGTSLLIDGTHRFVAAAVQGAEKLRARMLPEAVWKNWLIEDFPAQDEEALLASSPFHADALRLITKSLKRIDSRREESDGNRCGGRLK